MRSASTVMTLLVVAVAAGCGGQGTTVVVPTPASVQKFSSALPAGVYRVPSGSMEPTLRVGARVAVKAIPPRVGDIVVYYPPEGAVQEECGPTPHVVKLGGAACSAPVPTPANFKFIKRIITAEHWFMLGDNRGESDDSRFWGPVPASWIVGTEVRVIRNGL
jgi:type IV secretory pathway protease TraF